MNTVADSIHRNLDLNGARAALEDKLKNDEKVGGLRLADLIESHLSGPQCDMAMVEVRILLLTAEPDRSLYITRYLDRLVKEYLDQHEELVQEEAEQAAAEPEEV